jgi:hypothetical protein
MEVCCTQCGAALTVAAVEVGVELRSHRLASLPFERAGHRLRCAVTGVKPEA